MIFCSIRARSDFKVVCFGFNPGEIILQNFQSQDGAVIEDGGQN